MKFNKHPHMDDNGSPYLFGGKFEEKSIKVTNANKLSLNIKKTKYTLFHIYSIRNKICLKLTTLEIGNKVIEKTPSIKLLGVMLDENVSCKYHIKTVEINY